LTVDRVASYIYPKKCKIMMGCEMPLVSLAQCISSFSSLLPSFSGSTTHHTSLSSVNRWNVLCLLLYMLIIMHCHGKKNGTNQFIFKTLENKIKIYMIEYIYRIITRVILFNIDYDGNFISITKIMNLLHWLVLYIPNVEYVHNLHYLTK